MYAAKAYEQYGTPIPGHLKAEVTRQAAEKKAAADAMEAFPVEGFTLTAPAGKWPTCDFCSHSTLN